MKATLLIASILLVSCVADEPRAKRVLEEAGYTDIQIQGYAWIGCSDSDDYKTAFRAKGPTGRPTKGAVCCGIVKNCTIRTE